MDHEEALTTTENVLSELIADTLTSKYGGDWIDQRVDENTRDRWRDRLTEEQSRRKGAKVDDRLIYYSELADLRKLLKNDWDVFAPCFGSLKTMELDMKRLITYRHPEHHGRELLPFEQHLVLGITGEIRNKVTMFRSERDPEEEYFPRIEYVGDSFGNVARPPQNDINTDLTLRPGDAVTFTCRGWDPKGEPLDWRWDVGARSGGPHRLVSNNEFTWDVKIRDVALEQGIWVFLISRRPFHRHQEWDGLVTFRYRVLPRSI